jgi:hypothetical protein
METSISLTEFRISFRKTIQSLGLRLVPSRIAVSIIRVGTSSMSITGQVTMTVSKELY